MNRITMSWLSAAALLIAVTATIGTTAEVSAAASQASALDDAAAALSESLLWSFGGGNDGQAPRSNLIWDKWGNLYGTAQSGGANAIPGAELSGPNGGTVFELSPPARQHTGWRESVLWSFGASGDGAGPLAGLLADKWGNLYGTTEGGGANAVTGPWGPNGGTVFELSPPARQHTGWRESVLWNFGASGDGYYPWAGLIADKWGNLYGTTYCGGTNSCFGSSGGTVFELSPPAGRQAQWRERVLWRFVANGDGAFPAAGLIADKWGNLYGTTYAGGVNGSGTVFELSPPTGQQAQWREKVLWSFGVDDDGQYPLAGLFADKWGNLFGTTTFGGANSCSGVIGCGTVFELSPPAGQQSQWRERVLWSFAATGGDGQYPYASLNADRWGNLYSTTSAGGVNGSNAGTIFKLSPPLGQQVQWSERVLWSFGLTPDDGNTPSAGLIADPWGNLYGTTLLGGAYNSGGTVFEFGMP
jgi:uncharacterized repeat protein (TIGR03803 family)